MGTKRNEPKMPVYCVDWVKGESGVTTRTTRERKGVISYEPTFGGKSYKSTALVSVATNPDMHLEGQVWMGGWCHHP